MSAPVSIPDAATRQRQILRDLAAEYGRQLRQILQVGELVKGSVYQIETRCGNPGCHCAQAHGRLHPATVLSWSEGGRTRMRSLGVDQRTPRPSPLRAVSSSAAGARRCGPDPATDAAGYRSAGTSLAPASSAPCRSPAPRRPPGPAEAAWLRFVTAIRRRMRNCSRKLCGLCPWQAGGKTGCATPTACSTIRSW